MANQDFGVLFFLTHGVYTCDAGVFQPGGRPAQHEGQGRAPVRQASGQVRVVDCQCRRRRHDRLPDQRRRAGVVVKHTAEAQRAAPAPHRPTGARRRAPRGQPAPRYDAGQTPRRLISFLYRGTLKMRDMKLWDMKMRHHVAGVENARHENARNAIVWNTACCICLSIAEQECISRQERTPDFAANCGCPICRSEITMVLRLY